MQTPPARLPLIAILRGIPHAEALAHVDALVQNGLDTIEIPLNTPDWQASLADVCSEFGQQAWIGAGTVLKEADLDKLEQIGVKLVITPNTRPALIAEAVARGFYVMAGFATPSEAFAALDAGAHALKLFPASSYGPDYVRALRAVLPDVPLFAVGGITPATLGHYLRAGCNGAGLGSELYRVGQSPLQTANKARAFIEAFQGAYA